MPDGIDHSNQPWVDYRSTINKIIIGNKITRISDSSFAYCKATEIIIGESVTYMGYYPFSYSDIRTLNIPASVNTIVGSPTLGALSCTAYTVDANNNYFTVQNGLLYNKAKTTLIACPANKAITNYTIIDSVTRINIYGFAYNKYLTTLHLNNVTQYNGYICAECPNLTTIYFKTTPTSISNYTFSNCSSITDIYVPWASGEVGGAPWGAIHATIHYNSTVH